MAECPVAAGRLRMKSRIVVCTTDSIAWEALCSAATAVVDLERVARLDEVADKDGPHVAAVVVDDRFLSILPTVERALVPAAPAYCHAVFMTMAEALHARWLDLLGGDRQAAPHQLLDWVLANRATPCADIWY